MGDREGGGNSVATRKLCDANRESGDTARAMSGENAEIVKRVYDAVARHNTGAVLAAYDSEVEWDISGSVWRDLTGRSVYRVHEELRAFYREWYDAWEKYEDAVEEVIEASEHVIVVATGER